MNRTLKGSAAALIALGVVLFTGLSILAGTPRDAIQMVRYAFPYMHRGDLHVGDAVPDIRLVALDGQSRFPLRERINGRPLVLVFGSFT